MADHAVDRGAAGVLAVAVVVALATVFVAIGTLAGVLIAHRSAQAAADAAALAGADTALGAAPGVPCGRAAAVAVADGAHLDDCVQHGGVVRVSVSVDALGLPVAGRAAARPPTARLAGDGPDEPRSGPESTVYGVR
ncbi:Rv3654c family TadE-like protein [uncultured Amnibacterium sp.]|uniref:Rv3654c family TadE-like protein n=1 Tax=uncultured Amnibacterium sp. TaxID=1631851 RepID=UPI0035C98C8B